MSNCRYAFGRNQHDTFTTVCVTHDNEAIFDHTMIDRKVLRLLWEQVEYSLLWTPMLRTIERHVKHALGEDPNA